MPKVRKGRQTPTKSIVLPYAETRGQEAISALTHGKTIITIAHRLATIENADQILVIDGGTVVQKGTHKELLAQRGTYQEFIKIREQAEGWRIQQ